MIDLVSNTDKLRTQAVAAIMTALGGLQVFGGRTDRGGVYLLTKSTVCQQHVLYEDGEPFLYETTVEVRVTRRELEE